MVIIRLQLTPNPRNKPFTPWRLDCVINFPAGNNLFYRI